MKSIQEVKSAWQKAKDNYNNCDADNQRAEYRKQYEAASKELKAHPHYEPEFIVNKPAYHSALFYINNLKATCPPKLVGVATRIENSVKAILQESL